MRRSRLIKVSFGLIAFGILLYVRIVPVGASILPFLLASVDNGHILPDRDYRVFYNDAGAAHSGYHWTWIVDDRVFYRIVVAEGYSEPEVRYGRQLLPVRGGGEDLEVGFNNMRDHLGIDWVKVPYSTC